MGDDSSVDSSGLADVGPASISACEGAYARGDAFFIDSDEVSLLRLPSSPPDGRSGKLGSAQCTSRISEFYDDRVHIFDRIFVYV